MVSEDCSLPLRVTGPIFKMPKSGPYVRAGMRSWTHPGNSMEQGRHTRCSRRMQILQGARLKIFCHGYGIARALCLAALFFKLSHFLGLWSNVQTDLISYMLGSLALLEYDVDVAGVGPNHTFARQNAYLPNCKVILAVCIAYLPIARQSWQFA